MEAACALAIFLVYSRSLGFEFVYDDVGQILRNGMLKSWHTFSLALGTHVWKDLYPLAPGNYYRPLFVFWLFLNRWAFQYRPAGWHFTTVLMHVIACILVFRISRKIGLALYPAAFCALLFGIHPVHLESVAWVSGVNDSLMAVPLLASYLCYLHWKESGGGIRLGGSLLLFALSLLAKETAVVLPLIVLADLWIDGGSRTSLIVRRSLITCASMFMVLGGYLGLRWFVLGSLGHSTIALPFRVSILTWPKLFGFYFRLLVFPMGLGAFYDLSYIQSLLSPQFLLPLLMLLIIGVGLWHWQARPGGRSIRLGIVWLILPLLPVLNLAVFQSGEFAHDRYLYLSTFGFAVLVTAALARAKGASQEFATYTSRSALLAVSILCLLGICSAYQARFWGDDLALFTRAIAVAPRNCTASNNLGSAYLTHGQLDQARTMYESTMERCPNFWLSTYNLGFLNYRTGNQPKAENYLLRAIQLDPTDGDEFLYLGLARYRMNRLSEALADLRHAVELRPAEPGYHFALGMLLEQVPDWSAARVAFQEEVRINPANSAAAQELEHCRRKLAENSSGTPSA